jgi:hypothetical protein
MWTLNYAQTSQNLTASSVGKGDHIILVSADFCLFCHRSIFFQFLLLCEYYLRVVVFLNINNFYKSFHLVKMREVISVHVGQAGVQIGNACCKSFQLFRARQLYHNYVCCL